MAPSQHRIVENMQGLQKEAEQCCDRGCTLETDRLSPTGSLTGGSAPTLSTPMCIIS